MNRFKKKMHFKKKWRDLEDSINLQHKPDEYEFEDFEQCENYFTTSESEAENVNVNEKCRRGMSTRNFSVLSSFYGDILYKLLKKFSIKNADLEESVNHITRIYNSLKKGKLPEDIDYGEITNCLGYLHKYAPCHSALVCKCMVKVLISSSACVLTNIFQKASLDVVFLGSGPGNDFVGFMHALDEKCKIPSNINVTVVDKMSGWTEIFLESVQELKSSKEVCKISEHINVIPSFMVHDLKQCIVHNEEMKMKMRNADIVFLVKVLSRIPHEYKLTVLKNIIWSMSQGSILIYIDNTAPSTVFQQLYDNLDLKYEIENKRYGFNLKKPPSRFNRKTCSNYCKACVKIFSIK